MERYEWAKTVRRRIREEYQSFDAFAGAIHYSSGYVNNVLAGLRSNSVEQIISEKLGIEQPERS